MSVRVVVLATQLNGGARAAKLLAPACAAAPVNYHLVSVCVLFVRRRREPLDAVVKD